MRGKYPVYIKSSNKEIKQQPPPIQFPKGQKTLTDTFQRHTDDKEGCKSKPPASKVQWKGTKQRKEGETVLVRPEKLESCTTGENVHLCLLRNAVHRPRQEGLGLFYLCSRHTHFHLLTLTEILFLTGFYQHFYF